MMGSSAPQTRRSLLVGAIAAVGAAVAQMLGQPPQVNADDEIIQVGGEYHTSTSVTWISSATNSTHDVFRADSGGSGAGLVGVSGNGSGVVGTGVLGHGVVGTSSFGNGVYGFSSQAPAVRGESEQYPGVHGTSDDAFGVWGVSSNLYGGVFQGGKAQLRLMPQSSSGKPSTGSHQKGEIYMDSRGSLFICTAQGTPGTWKKVVAKLA